MAQPPTSYVISIIPSYKLDISPLNHSYHQLNQLVIGLISQRNYSHRTGAPCGDRSRWKGERNHQALTSFSEVRGEISSCPNLDGDLSLVCPNVAMDFPKEIKSHMDFPLLTVRRSPWFHGVRWVIHDNPMGHPRYRFHALDCSISRRGYCWRTAVSMAIKKQAGSMKSWKRGFILCIQELRIKIVYYQY